MLVWSASAQGQYVDVAVTSSLVVYSLSGVDLSLSFLYDSISAPNAGYWDICGGVVLLNSSVVSTATFLFNGTEITVYFHVLTHGGFAHLYLDGEYWETIGTGWSSSSDECLMSTSINIGLSEQTHNVTVINSDPLYVSYLAGFSYIPFTYVTPTTTLSLTTETQTTAAATSAISAAASAISAATSTISATPRSIGPIIGGVIGGLVILLGGVIIIIILIRRRRPTREPPALSRSPNGPNNAALEMHRRDEPEDDDLTQYEPSITAYKGSPGSPVALKV
ncbi:hypothetical protein FRB98_008241 [Tulasnella sp. 332]|nr:hypothetical protein FRB98_008241 [Tulasnella sp. 332]